MMEEAQESDEGRRIREAARSLGLSTETMKGLAPIELDLPFTAAGYPQERQTSSNGSPGDVLIAELRDRIAVLERRLDDADAERHELFKVAAAERKRLVQLLLQSQSRSAWPGIWPKLQQLHRRFSKKMP